MTTASCIREDQVFMNLEQAQQHYGFGLATPETFTPLEKQLIAGGVGRIAMTVEPTAFEECIELFDHAVADSPEALEQTAFKTDMRFGNDIGYVRKEAKFNDNGLQYQDAKSLFHFNELARDYWQVVLPNPPRSVSDFLEAGFDIHQDLIKSAKATLANVEGSHPGISRAYFDALPNGADSFSFMRILSYDAYDLSESTEEVARPHFDIGGLTIQAYADAPGFWGNIYSGADTERIRHDTIPGEAYVFFGAIHRKMYKGQSPFRPLWHGVDRIVDPASLVGGIVPRRHAVILFVDPPYIDFGISPEDTSPHLYN